MIVYWLQYDLNWLMKTLVKWIEFENVERVAGETKWSFWKLLLYSIEGIVAFSTAPLAIASLIGMLMLFIAVIFIIFIILQQYLLLLLIH